MKNDTVSVMSDQNAENILSWSSKKKLSYRSDVTIQMSKRNPNNQTASPLISCTQP